MTAAVYVCIIVSYNAWSSLDLKCEHTPYMNLSSPPTEKPTNFDMRFGSR